MTSEVSYKGLKKYCYFSNLSHNALEVLSKKLQIVEHPAGTHIIREGEPADAFYMVKKGEVEVSKKTPTGKSTILSIKGDGEGFGEMALLTCSPRIASVAAKTDVILLKLLKSDFEDWIQPFHRLWRVRYMTMFNSIKSKHSIPLRISVRRKYRCFLKNWKSAPTRRARIS
jgi:CRP-like cAMP-binding protein